MVLMVLRSVFAYLSVSSPEESGTGAIMAPSRNKTTMILSSFYGKTFTKALPQLVFATQKLKSQILLKKNLKIPDFTHKRKKIDSATTRNTKSTSTTGDFLSIPTGPEKIGQDLLIKNTPVP